VTFSSTLPSVPDPIVPPFRTGIVPDGSRSCRLRTWLAWRRLFAYRRIRQAFWSYNGQVLDFARRIGFPLAEVDVRVETWARLSFPELVLCPSDFDFPRSTPPRDAHFVEASVDLERQVEREPSRRGPRVGAASSPLARNGAAGGVPARTRAFVQAFLDAVARRRSGAASRPRGRAPTCARAGCP
jgi:hypothetical protein